MSREPGIGNASVNLLNAGDASLDGGRAGNPAPTIEPLSDGVGTLTMAPPHATARPLSKWPNYAAEVRYETTERR